MTTAAAVVEWEVDVQGVPVRYRTAGDGDPVVLVHGLSGSTRWWTPVLPALAARSAVHLVDLPGFGSMRRGGRSPGLAHAATWLAAWMDALGLERPALVGHSMGSAIVLRVAAARPERLDRLALVAPAGLPVGRSLAGYAVPLLTALRRSTPRFLPVLVADALRAGPSTLLGATLDVVEDDVRGELGRIRVPTLVLMGERDTLVPPAVGELVRRELPSARLVVLERAGHVPMYDRPDAFSEALLAFLAEERRAA